MDTPKGDPNDADVVRWQHDVRARGGIVSAEDVQSVANYVLGLKVSGRWPRYEICWPHWLTNEIAAHTPIKDVVG